MIAHICLVDDWELRGDGSGNPRTIQFEQMRKLSNLYDNHGLKGTFNVEVMQQLYHKKLGEQHPELKQIAREWEDVVLETYLKGHDMQLHIHPQWDGATYKGGTWILQENWSITALKKERKRELIQSCKNYLEYLIRTVDPGYQCISYRSGTWAIAPCPDMMSLLAENNIVFDMSLVNGIRCNLDMVEFDYRHIEEPFFPYYPNMTDARRLSSEKQPIVCCPTNSFNFPRLAMLKKRGLQVLKKPNAMAPNSTAIINSGTKPTYSNKWKPQKNQNILSQISDRIVDDFISPITRIADISQLSYLELDYMLKRIIRKTQRSKTPVPIMLENHTKDIGNFEPIKRFCEKLSKMPGAKVLTAREVAENIKNGIYDIKRRGA